MISNLFLWNHSLRSQINLRHCSPGEIDRGERAKSVVKCYLSVKIFFHPVGTSEKCNETGVLHAIMISNLFLWNHSLRSLVVFWIP